jgi:hypothetical protein
VMPSPEQPPAMMDEDVRDTTPSPQVVTPLTVTPPMGVPGHGLRGPPSGHFKATPAPAFYGALFGTGGSSVAAPSTGRGPSGGEVRAF